MQTSKNKIAIIGTAGIPANYGGFETLTEYLTQHLGESLDLTVFCSSKNYPQKQSAYNNARLLYIPLNANGVQSILYDIVSMFRALFFADVFLILGVSGCIMLPFIRLISRKHIVVNIDGLEWKRDKWHSFAKWFLKFSEKMAVQFSDEVITDNKAIQDYVTQEYGVQSNLIAYGADHAIQVPITDAIRTTYPFINHEYAFTVCRIEPENNIHIILDAFSHVDFPFIMIGNWQNSEYGRELKARFSTQSNIHLYEPIYDQHILNQLRGTATLYIHGHSAGGTNPSLVEAMYLGLAIIAFDINYNRETTENSAKYFTNSTTLQEHINTLNVEELSLLKQKMSEIAQRRYTWEIIVGQYAQVIGSSRKQ
ncbi:MAG: DUF1972 domain-containing protein [Desulfobacula sp.]|jgi:glycosyltransferase involved in cell wall biosynthesis|nr:DUF1972 domain-containing protein [Desulfobacula sp.]